MPWPMLQCTTARSWMGAVADAAVHDSQELDGLLDKGNTCNDVFADSAYRIVLRGGVDDLRVPDHYGLERPIRRKH